MLAAQKGHAECIKELIAAGADINKANKNGWTALMISAYQGHLESLKELITAGSEVEKQNKLGDTALIVGAKHNVQRNLKL